MKKIFFCFSILIIQLSAHAGKWHYDGRTLDPTKWYFDAQKWRGGGHLFDPKPRYFNVKSFGAQGNGVRVSDVSINSGSANAISVTTTFTSADIGKYIKIDSAGASSVDFVTTIIAVGGAHSITLNTTAGHSVTNATCRYGTDDTRAIQKAVNACVANGGGIVFSPEGIYILADTLQTSIGGQNPNSLIFVPMVTFLPNTSGQTPISVEIQGESRTSIATSVINVYAIPNNGTVWQSFATGSGTYPSILATGSTNDASQLNFVDIRLRNMNFQVIGNAVGGNGPGMCGVNLGNFGNAIVNDVSIMIDHYLQSSVKPTNSVFGLNMITSTEGTWNYCNNVLVAGFKWGYIFGEHFWGGDIQAMACQIAISPSRADHSSEIIRLGVYWCNFAVKPDVGYGSGGVGNHRIEIHELSMEVDTLTAHWWKQTFSISDASNFLFGRCSHSVVLKGVGHNDAFFTVSGATNYHNYSIDDPYSSGTPTLDQVLTAGNSTAQQINITGVTATRPTIRLGSTMIEQQILSGDAIISQNVFYNGSFQYLTTDNVQQFQFYDNGGGTNGAIVAQFAVNGTGGTTATLKAPFQIDGNSTGGLVVLGGNQSAYDGTATGGIVVVDNTNIFPVTNLTPDLGKSGNAWRDVYYSHTISKTAIGGSTGLGVNVSSLTGSGSDEDFTATVVTSGNVSGTIGHLTFGRDWGATPHCIVSAADVTTGTNIFAGGGNYLAANATSSTDIIFTGATTGAHTFVINCHCGL